MTGGDFRGQVSRTSQKPNAAQHAARDFLGINTHIYFLCLLQSQSGKGESTSPSRLVSFPHNCRKRRNSAVFPHRGAAYQFANSLRFNMRYPCGTPIPSMAWKRS